VINDLDIVIGEGIRPYHYHPDLLVADRASDKGPVIFITVDYKHGYGSDEVVWFRTI
jgi:hypothetical protein